MVPPKSFILIGFSIINHPFWGTIIFGNPHILLTFWIHVSMDHWVGHQKWHHWYHVGPRTHMGVISPTVWVTRVSPLLDLMITSLMDLENEFGFIASFPKNPSNITSTCFEAEGVSEGLVFQYKRIWSRIRILRVAKQAKCQVHAPRWGYTTLARWQDLQGLLVWELIFTTGMTFLFVETDSGWRFVQWSIIETHQIISILRMCIRLYLFTSSKCEEL